MQISVKVRGGKVGCYWVRLVAPKFFLGYVFRLFFLRFFGFFFSQVDDFTMHFMDWEMFFICSECNEMKWIRPECHKLVKSQLEFVTRQKKLKGNAAGKSLTEKGVVWGCAPHTHIRIHEHIICDNNVANLTLIRHKWEQFYFIMQICGGTKKAEISQLWAIKYVIFLAKCCSSTPALLQ